MLPPGGVVYVLGGEVAVSAAVAQDLATMGFVVRRLEGPDRVATSIAVARQVLALDTTFAGAGAPRMVLARAYGVGSAGWADSVTGGAWAADSGVPVVITPTESLDPRVANLLAEEGVSETILLGGEAALSSAVAAAVPGPRRIAGADRAETGAAVAGELWGGASGYLVVNGYDEQGWAFGLASSGLAADLGMPLLVSTSQDVPAATMARLGLGCGTTPSLETALIGGLSLLGEEVRAAIDSHDGGECPADPAPQTQSSTL